MPVVHAVIVLFYPDADFLTSILFKFGHQVDKIWLINNGSAQSICGIAKDLKYSRNIEIVQNNNNLGLGAAQNLGLNFAFANAASHVLILDQDSQPHANMVENLLCAAKKLHDAGIDVAAVAPLYQDNYSEEKAVFLKIGLMNFYRIDFSIGDPFVEVDLIISSGSLISRNAFSRIGPMDEALFIDLVDTEWCMRALSKGFKFYGVPSAGMTHCIGFKRKKYWFLFGRSISFHSPFRYYYIIRNSIILQRRNYIPWLWRFTLILRCTRVIFFYGLFSFNRFQCLKYMFKGIWHGLKGISGPYKD